MNRFSRLLLLSSLTALTACSGDDVRSAIGLERSAPDEFRVVSRPPLSVPPEFTLRPPQPGEDDVAALPADKLTRSMITGTTATFDTASNTLPTKADGTPVVDTAVMPVESGDAPSGAESELMSKFGTEHKESDIRTKIVEDHVVKEKEKEEDWFSIDALNPWAKDKDTLDAKDEVKKLKDEGKPVVGKHLVLNEEPKAEEKKEEVAPAAGEEKKAEEKKEEPKAEEAKPGVKTEEKPDALKVEAPKTEEAKPEVKAEEAPKVEEKIQDTPKSEEVKKEAPAAETPKLDEPKTVLRTEEKPDLAKPEVKPEETRAPEAAPAESGHTTFKDLKDSKENVGTDNFKIEVPASQNESLINLNDGNGPTTTEELRPEEETKAVEGAKAANQEKAEEPKKEEAAKELEKAKEEPKVEKPKVEKPKAEKPKAAKSKAKPAPKKESDSGPASKPATTSFPSKIIVN